nr:unnamed protein product [Digitaria exilis]
MPAPACSLLLSTLFRTPSLSNKNAAHTGWSDSSSSSQPRMISSGRSNPREDADADDRLPQSNRSSDTATDTVLLRRAEHVRAGSSACSTVVAGAVALPKVLDEKERAAAVAVDDDDNGGLTLLVSPGTYMQHVNGGALPAACFAACFPRPKEYSVAMSGTSLPQRCGSLAFRSVDGEVRSTSSPASASSASQPPADSLLLGCASVSGLAVTEALSSPATDASGEDTSVPGAPASSSSRAGEAWARWSSTETEGMGRGLSMSSRENWRSEKGSMETSLTSGGGSSGSGGRCHRKVSSQDAPWMESLAMAGPGQDARA